MRSNLWKRTLGYGYKSQRRAYLRTNTHGGGKVALRAKRQPSRGRHPMRLFSGLSKLPGTEQAIHASLQRVW